MLLGAVVFVLLIAQRECGKPPAGASRGPPTRNCDSRRAGASLVRLARQFVTEGILLHCAEPFSAWRFPLQSVRLVQLTNSRRHLRARMRSAMDWRVLLFTLATSLLTGVLFGLAPSRLPAA